MKTKIVLAALFLCLVLTVQKGFGIFLSGDNTLVSQTKQAVLIIAGKVSDIQYVYRDDIYTDVTITVSKTLKGQPNIEVVKIQFDSESKAASGETHSRRFQLSQNSKWDKN